MRPRSCRGCSGRRGRRDLHARVEARLVRRRTCRARCRSTPCAGSHDRAAAILFSPDWTDAGERVRDARLHGVQRNRRPRQHEPVGRAQHAHRRGAGCEAWRTIAAPSANADLAPTLLKVLGLPIPTSMEGRVLDEMLANGKPLAAGEVRTLTHVVSTKDGAYTLTGAFSVVRSGGRDYRYFDSTTVVRK